MGKVYLLAKTGVIEMLTLVIFLKILSLYDNLPNCSNSSFFFKLNVELVSSII